MKNPRPQTVIRIRKGLDIPITGVPEQAISESAPVRSLALLGDDYPGLRPKLLVAEGDAVSLGQVLFEDRNNPGVKFMAPGSGRIRAIHRGARRKLQSIVIELQGQEEITFNAWQAADIHELREAEVRENLLASGLWTAFRTRPFSRVPRADAQPVAIFVTAIDTEPLAGDPAVVIQENATDFANGLSAICRLSADTIYVCAAPEATITIPDNDRLRLVRFAGPHPAGLAGTHIHFLQPVDSGKSVWHLDYQDVIAIGRLFVTGRLSTTRVIALAGPPVIRPRLIRARLGASTNDLTQGELREGSLRIVSGSPLSGRRAAGWAGYLGRYHSQISVLAEGYRREFLGWLSPGRDRFSASRVFLSSFLGRRQFDLTTSQHGSPRAMVPIGSYEKVMPLDLLATPLLKSLLVRDTDTAQTLGCLELDEEDLALCSFVCCSKYDYGLALRECLTLIEQAGR
jgi:Na+-transporting NADH:ubiquinone oxidoreductase subunit A